MPRRRVAPWGYAGIVVIVGISLVPTIYMVDLSFRTTATSFQPVLVAAHPTLINYFTVLTSGHLIRFFINSAVVAVSSVLLTLVCSVMAGFAITRLKVVGRNVVFYWILSALLIPLASLLIPLTILLKTLHGMNTYWGLIGPYTALGIPFAMLIIKGVMDSFPSELEEAAVLDGASPPQVLRQIIVPIIWPSLMVVAIWQFLFSWNEFFLALVVMTRTSMKTMPLLPLYFEGSYMTNPGEVFAVLSIVSVVPMVVYLLVQRWFVSGLSSGGIKG